MRDEILLLRNRPAEADPLLDRAVVDQGGNPRLLALLAECRRRRGGLSNKLALLADGGQYLLPAGAEIQVHWPSQSALPLAEARENGTAGHLPRGTGVGETLVDPALARFAEVEVAGDTAWAGFRIASEMQSRPSLCCSVEAAGARRSDLPGMLIGEFRLEHQFVLHNGGLVGDGLVRGGALTLGFENMRLTPGP